MRVTLCATLLALAAACGGGAGDAAQDESSAQAPAGESAAAGPSTPPAPQAETPVDSGSFAATVTGTPSGSWRGTASFTPSFNTAGKQLIVITMSSPADGERKNQIKLVHVGSLPGPGEYVITGEERDLRGEIGWPGAGLPSSVSQPGRLTITTSDSASVPRRLAGTFQFTGADPTGKPQATVSGEFTASCTMAFRAC